MRETLKSYFGYSQFRPMQESVIRHILAGKDCLVLMPPQEAARASVTRYRLS